VNGIGRILITCFIAVDDDGIMQCYELMAAVDEYSEYYKSLDTTGKSVYTRKLTVNHCDRTETLSDPYAMAKLLWNSDILLSGRTLIWRYIQLFYLHNRFNC